MAEFERREQSGHVRKVRLEDEKAMNGGLIVVLTICVVVGFGLGACGIFRLIN